jgi:hypothetical protein
VAGNERETGELLIQARTRPLLQDGQQIDVPQEQIPFELISSSDLSSLVLCFLTWLFK